MTREKAKQLVENETSGKWTFQHYRSWLKNPTKCSFCGKEVRKIIAIKEGGAIVKTICPDCLRGAGYSVIPATMEINDDAIAEQIAKKLERVFAQNPILQSLTYREDITTIIKKTCDKMKQKAQHDLDEELAVFTSYENKDA